LPTNRFKTLIFVIVGMMLGLWAGQASEEVLGLLAGGVIALLLARQSTLERRIRSLRFRRPVAGSEARTSSGDTLHRPDDQAWAAATDVQDTANSAAASSTRTVENDAVWPTPEAETWPTRENTPAQPGPSLLSRALEYARNWLTRGNVPVKVGVIISFIGFSFLLKYAIDRELIFLPLKLRLMGVGVFGLVLLVLGWRLRQRVRTYALSLQGGGLGIMFLTVFAAFRVWAMLSPGWAFSLLVLLAFATGALSLIQNARTLAILGVVGGFLAPLLASTGQGSHVALFSYNAVINGAVFGLAWFRAWRGLNLIGWGFTFAIGCFWGYQYYRPVHFSSIEPFLVLFFLMYNVIAMLFALRRQSEKIGMVDGTLVFGTPVVIFAVQAALLSDSEYGLAWSAVALAMFYVLAALGLARRKDGPWKLLIESYKALAVAFITLAIPLALDARWTSGAWALEGAALIWIGTRQSHHLANFAGTLLVLGAGLAFLDEGWVSGRGLAVLNGNVLGGLLVSLSALFATRQLDRFRTDGMNTENALGPAYRLASIGLFAWGITWWVGTGLLESLDRIDGDGKLHGFLLFMAVSTALGLYIDQLKQWSALRRSGLLLVASMVFVGLWDFIEKQHFLFELGGVTWPFSLAALVWWLWNLDQRDERDWGAWHFVGVLLLTTLLTIETFWQVDLRYSETWSIAAAVAVAGIVPWVIHFLHLGPAWPVSAHPGMYLSSALLVVLIQAAFLSWLSVVSPGNPDPLFYLPVFNPFDLALLAVGGAALVSLRLIRVANANADQITVYRWLLGGAFFVLTTAALVRGVYHVGGGSWRWASLFESVLVQTSLSIYWAILGFGGMIWGARTARRPLWLVGAAFMLLVVLKLFTVDLTQTGTIERIISFIGVGILLLVVGYFAPAPPRDRQEQ